MEAKIDKLDFINIKNFCVAKDMIKEVKRQPADWEGYLQVLCLKRVKCIGYKHLLHLTIKDSPSEAGRGLEQTFLQRRRAGGQ